MSLSESLALINPEFAHRNVSSCIPQWPAAADRPKSNEAARHGECTTRGMVRFEWTQAYETDPLTASLLDAAAAAGEEASVLSILILGVRNGSVRVVGR